MLNKTPLTKQHGLIFFNHPFKITIKYFPAIERILLARDGFVIKLSSSHSLLLHTLEAKILSMQKKYPTNFLNPLDISEYNSCGAKNSRAYAVAPLPASSAGGLFFALRLRGAAFFLSPLLPLPGATMPRNCRTGVRLA